MKTLYRVSDQYYGTILSKVLIERVIDPKNLSKPACTPISEQDFKINDYTESFIADRVLSDYLHQELVINIVK